MLDKSIYSDILGNLGVPKAHSNLLPEYNLPGYLKCSSMKHLWDIIGLGVISKREKIFVKEKKGETKVTLLKDEESYIVVHYAQRWSLVSDDVVYV